jgi:hypothetical protein
MQFAFTVTRQISCTLLDFLLYSGFHINTGQMTFITVTCTWGYQLCCFPALSSCFIKFRKFSFAPTFYRISMAIQIKENNKH